MSERVLVVGGGIVGILAAARHRAAGADVVLVDAARLGGLLRSTAAVPGIWVDQGTHVPAETGDADLDAWLFASVDDDTWTTHPRLLAGSAFGGRLDDRTPFPDLNRLPGGVRAEVEAGLLAAPRDPAGAGTVAEELDAVFGEPARRQVFEPLIRKWYGASADEVGPGAHRIGLNRVVAFTAERTAELKAEGPDVSLAWHDATVGASPLRAHYPVHGGCGRWIEELVAGLGDVEVHEGVRAQLRAEGDVVVAATIDGIEERVDRVVSTVPPAVLLMAMGRPPGGSGPPRFVRTALVDLVVDRPLGTHLHYFTVHDPDPITFRVTLYPNLRGRAAEGPFVLTAEVLGDVHGPDGAPLADEQLVAQVRRELEELGVVDPEARLLHGGVRTLPVGFPVPPVGGPDPAAEEAVASFANVDALGRGSGGRFFLADVLLDAHRRLP